jgi:hypothetical protein
MGIRFRWGFIQHRNRSECYPCKFITYTEECAWQAGASGGRGGGVAGAWRGDVGGVTRRIPRSNPTHPAPAGAASVGAPVQPGVLLHAAEVFEGVQNRLDAGHGGAFEGGGDGGGGEGAGCRLASTAAICSRMVLGQAALPVAVVVDCRRRRARGGVVGGFDGGLRAGVALPGCW